MFDALLVRPEGRIEKRADDYLSSNVATVVDPASLFPSSQENIVSWDDLSADVVAELMIWENASDQDLRYLDGLAE
jgi:hypothetical protein